MRFEYHNNDNDLYFQQRIFITLVKLNFLEKCLNVGIKI